MLVPLNFVYLVATLPLVIVWIALFSLRKDLRKEMLIMSLIMSVVSVATSYYWWTIDWWQPPTIFGTKVGIEDFITGFAAGGIMAAIYEVVFKKKLYKRKKDKHEGRGIVLLLLLFQIMSWLFWGVGLTSFNASVISMAIIAMAMLFIRKDLFIDQKLSGRRWPCRVKHQKVWSRRRRSLKRA